MQQVLGLENGYAACVLLGRTRYLIARWSDGWIYRYGLQSIRLENILTENRVRQFLYPVFAF
jgi:hypothetical protein